MKKDDFWFGILALAFIVLMVLFLIALVRTQWADAGAIVCNDVCSVDRKINQVEHCMTREVLTRIECVILVSNDK